MSRKSTLPFVVEAAKSLAATFTTTPTVINYLDNVAYQIIVTTTDSSGTFAVQASLDYRANSAPEFPVANTGTWTDLPLGGATATPVANAANDTIVINLNQLPFSAIRIAYTAGTAGTGTCKILLFAKSIGA